MVWYSKSKYAALIWMMRNERRSRTEITELQTRKLRQLVKHTYENVTLYRELYDGAGLTPDSVERIDDLRLLPTVSKRDLQNVDLSDCLDRQRDADNLLSVRTSGSSGLALEIFFDRSYDQLRKAQYLRPYLTNGRRLTDRVMRFCAESNPPPKWFTSFGLLRESFVYANSNIDDHIQRIKAERPNVIQGYGSELSLIAQAILNGRASIPKPRIVFTDSELLTPGFRNLIEEAFGVDVIDIYGTYEVGNVGYECTEHNGYHLAEDCVITEFLDHEGNPVEPGQEGEIVFTVLNNYSMPLIRYRIGDAARYSLEDCPCGRTSIRISHILGRLNDFAVCRDGTRKSPLALLGRFKVLLGDLVYEFQVVQRGTDDFEVRVVPKKDLDTNLEQSMRAILTTEFPGATVRVRSVTSIPRLSSGKHKAFVQEHDHGVE